MKLILEPVNCCVCHIQIKRGHMIELGQVYGNSGEYVCAECVAKIKSGNEVSVWVSEPFFEKKPDA